MHDWSTVTANEPELADSESPGSQGAFSIFKRLTAKYSHQRWKRLVWELARWCFTLIASCSKNQNKTIQSHVDIATKLQKMTTTAAIWRRSCPKGTEWWERLSTSLTSHMLITVITSVRKMWAREPAGDYSPQNKGFTAGPITSFNTWNFPQTVVQFRWSTYYSAGSECMSCVFFFFCNFVIHKLRSTKILPEIYLEKDLKALRARRVVCPGSVTACGSRYLLNIFLMQNNLKSSKDIRTFKWFPINLILFLLSLLSFLLLNLVTWLVERFQCQPYCTDVQPKCSLSIQKCVI